MGAVIPLRRIEAVAPPTFADETAAIFAVGGPLARGKPNYAPRDGQVRLARFIAETIDAGGAALAEGACGVGKSFAYLIPAILRARATGRSVLIATATIALQEQLLQKDLPALAAMLDLPGGPLTFAMLKGRGNYACLLTMDQPAPAYLSPEEVDELARVDAWAKTTATGDRAELPFVVRESVWSLRSMTTDECVRDGCEFYEVCHARAAKARAEDVDIVVVNMALLAAHVSVYMEMRADAVLPRTGPRESPIAWDTVILDEAHELSDIAREFFGCQLTEKSIARLGRWCEREGAPEVGAAIAREARTLFFDLDTRVPEPVRGREPEPVRIREGIDTEALCAALAALRAHAAKVAAPLRTLVRNGVATREQTKTLRSAENAARRAARVASWLEAVGSPAESPEVVLWIEARTGKYSRDGRLVTLQGRHVEPGEILARYLWGRTRALVATSATLTTGAGVDGWHWIKRQLGAPEDVRTLSVPSPFDFARQARLVLPAGMPDSKSDRDGFDRAVCDTLVDVARGALAHGGVLGLFTSRRVSDMAAARARAAGIPRLAPVLAQGEQPRAQLVDAMRAGPALLCGTASLWTGVDLQGDACVALVIDKLPFPPPGDPVMQAIEERLAARTGDVRAAFREEALPRVILRMRQGVGRLIRATGDRGVVVICDPRLVSTGYGAQVLRALGLPARAASVADALAWLAAGEAGGGAR